MRDLFTGLLLASCLVPFGIGGMKISSYLMEAPAPHSFANLDAPLWASEVKRIDVSQQAYERLPALSAPDTMLAGAGQENRSVRKIGYGTRDSETTPDGVAGIGATGSGEEVAATVTDWCGARYRSYDQADNSYQPYGGGPRRICKAPGAVAAVPMDKGIFREVDARARWCMDRYSSYRIEDNSYQPFSGSRKQCAGPEAQSASNITRAAGNLSVAEF